VGFLFSFVMYGATLFLWRKVRGYLYGRFEGSKAVRYANRIIFWTLPLLVLVGLYRMLDNLAMVLVIGAIWGIVIAIYVTSHYIYDRNINIERVTGRRARLKRVYFRLVMSIPLIGKRRRPSRRCVVFRSKLRRACLDCWDLTGRGNRPYAYHYGHLGPELRYHLD